MEQQLNMAKALDAWGESWVLVACGALAGLVFGLAAQRSRFCTRAAVIEWCEGRSAVRLSVWWLGLAAALLATQCLVVTGHLQPGKTRFIGDMGSLSGVLLGGLLFGAGMVLARGCASRMLILSAGGNLRALVAGLVFALTVQASISGWLAPARQWLTGLWRIDGGSGRDLLALTGIGPWGGLLLALLALVAGVVLFARQHGARLWLAVGALCCGLAVAAGWALTQAVASESLEVVSVQSLSYSYASAEWLMRALGSASVPPAGFEAGMLPATFVGAALGALLGREFRLEGFKTENRLGHYLTGAVLMGFGAVMAGGCTVGAGVGGTAVFALTAWLTLASIWLGGALTWRLHKAMGWTV